MRTEHEGWCVCYGTEFGSVLHEDRCLQALCFTLFLLLCSYRTGRWHVRATQFVCDHLATGFHLLRGPPRRSVYKIPVNTYNADSFYCATECPMFPDALCLLIDALANIFCGWNKKYSKNTLQLKIDQTCVVEVQQQRAFGSESVPLFGSWTTIQWNVTVVNCAVHKVDR